MPQTLPLNSYDEWSPLQEVIVGSADHYTAHHVDASFQLFYYDNVTPDPVPGGAGQDLLQIPQQLVDELSEDVTGLADALAACGVTVHRPATPGKDIDIRSPFWDARATPALNVRDNTIILGDMIVETAPHVRARIFENDLLKPVLYRYFEDGARWQSMPRPALARGSLDTGYFTRQGIDVTRVTDSDTALPLDGLGLELIFDGAQCMRLGRDVLVNAANYNHQLALRWLRQTLPHLRFHLLDAIADSHIDSVVVPLRPGLMLLREPKYLSYLPKAMQTWDVIYPPAMDEAAFPDYSDFGFNIASRYIDMNVLSVDQHTVVVNSLYPELIRVLEDRGFTVVPVRHRHRRLAGGGFHCFTLDTVRAGGCEDYLD
ncbi:inosamine-phosphate amidinotransferase 1 (plasmid) [Streptomyces sp. NBC_01281]|uniref:inosamine-phosphate amidinotransferase 1 n=1 Tax=Streptomyces sp. NBC_01281 TaxID=2903811 RepID=UPI002E146CF9|nr:inosamine-phosphate amidinotransferase 1 [Streptomyces sp. NBC_01281]